MSSGILIGYDKEIAEWAFAHHNRRPHATDRGIGIVDKATGKLVGAALFHSWNGHNASLSYYGQGTATLGIGRALAKIAILDLDLSRVTVVIPKKHKKLARHMLALGFKVEGVQRRYFGDRDCPRNTGVRFVMFRERILEFAKLNKETANVA